MQKAKMFTLAAAMLLASPASAMGNTLLTVSEPINWLKVITGVVLTGFAGTALVTGVRIILTLPVRNIEGDRWDARVGIFILVCSVMVLLSIYELFILDLPFAVLISPVYQDEADRSKLIAKIVLTLVIAMNFVWSVYGAVKAEDYYDAEGERKVAGFVALVSAIFLAAIYSLFWANFSYGSYPH